MARDDYKRSREEVIQDCKEETEGCPMSLEDWDKYVNQALEEDG